MRHIATTSTTVSKLKKRAKLLVREKSIQHAAALDEIAQSEQYDHWKHVLQCEEMTMRESKVNLSAVTGEILVTRKMPAPCLTIYHGPSGSGKSIEAGNYVLNKIRENEAVTIIDRGRTYEQLVAQVGGTSITLHEDGHSDIKVHGSAKLCVYECELIHSANVANIWPDIFSPPTRTKPSTIVIDEYWAVKNVWADLQGVLVSALKQKCDITLITILPGDIEKEMPELQENASTTKWVSLKKEFNARQISINEKSGDGVIENQVFASADTQDLERVSPETFLAVLENCSTEILLKPDEQPGIQAP